MRSASALDDGHFFAVNGMPRNRRDDAAALFLQNAGDEREVDFFDGAPGKLFRELLVGELPDLRILLPSRLPAGDGGLALGQALIAAARALP